ncbi:MAG: AAA family ATPase [Mitsuokella sp.]|uniref:AAA family ATPase n=2 Tax=unclassified Mitsuokella TaxID=2637239 RepID=UPI003EFBD290
MSRNNPRTRFSSSVSKVLYEKFCVVADATGRQKTALLDEALQLVVQKYRSRVLESGGKGASIFMAKTIAFCSHKGGVGKTTSAAAFADLLGRRDYRVLLIDADPQGNLSKRFGYHPKEYRGDVQLSSAVLNILSDNPKPMKEFTLSTQNANVDIIPNDDRYTATTKTLLDAVMLGINAYKIMLQELSGFYDYIIFDCRPAVDNEIAQVMRAVQYLMIPVNAADDSVDGVDTVLGYAAKIRNSNPDLRVAGIFFESINMRTAVAHDYVPQIRQKYAPLILDTIVPHSEDAHKAEARHLPVTEAYPSGKATRAYSKLVEEVLNRIG